MRFLSGSFFWLAAAVVMAQAPYNTNPDWRSLDRRYATGGAIADINGDGWPDVVVSNGNDMRTERNGVYISNAGVLPTSPTWESGDAAKHGHLFVADYDNDGDQDVAVALLNPLSSEPGIKIYRNDGGTLTSTPAWRSAASFYAWHPSWGDFDLDGDLDLLIGSSDAYGGRRWQNFIFINRGGVLDTTPGWSSADNRHLDHMEFADVDDDGDLDVVAIGSGTSNWIYRNNNGVIDTVPDWNSLDNTRQFANTLAIGDVTGDGRLDLIMSDNNQLSGGSGRFKLYRNNGAGSFEQTPGWSYFDGYVSGVALADLNNDGRLDLATGAWWDNTRIFMNTGSGFASSPTWNSSARQVVEMIAFGDINRDGLTTVREFKNINTGRTIRGPIPFGNPIQRAPGRKLYRLDRMPIERVVRVIVDGRVLARGDYSVNLPNSTITVAQAPLSSLSVEYVYSRKLDMLVTDWENNGNYVYLWR